VYLRVITGRVSCKSATEILISRRRTAAAGAPSRAVAGPPRSIAGGPRLPAQPGDDRDTCETGHGLILAERAAGRRRHQSRALPQHQGRTSAGPRSWRYHHRHRRAGRARRRPDRPCPEAHLRDQFARQDRPGHGRRACGALPPGHQPAAQLARRIGPPTGAAAVPGLAPYSRCGTRFAGRFPERPAGGSGAGPTRPGGPVLLPVVAEQVWAGRGRVIGGSSRQAYVPGDDAGQCNWTLRHAHPPQTVRTVVRMNRPARSRLRCRQTGWSAAEPG